MESATSRTGGRRLNRSTVRFTMTKDGTPGVVKYMQRRLYEELLRETPHWHSPLECQQDEDGDWRIVALVDGALTANHNRKTETVMLGQGYCWDSREEALKELEENEEELRKELTNDLFSMGLCTRCNEVIPVLGSYVPYAPAGELYCGPCRSEDEGEDAGPALVRSG